MIKYQEKIWQIIFLISALASIISVALICIFLFSNGTIALNKIGFWNFISGRDWKPANDIYGILPMILASLYVTLGSIVIGVPIAVLSAVFMAYFCPAKIHVVIKPFISLLAGIPSVVYGFFGLTVLVPFLASITGSNGKNMLTASILLGIMILPTIIEISESSIRAVPNKFYEGARALGASHERSVFTVILPAAKSGVISAMVLGIGRAIGETLAVIWVAGNQARMPKGILKGLRTLTANIVLEMGYAADLHREALIATGLILFIFILLINLALNLIKRRMSKE